jgi:hypothetical protein
VAKPVAGDVVVLPFPQTNLRPGKRRPALVVADLTGDAASFFAKSRVKRTTTRIQFLSVQRTFKPANLRFAAMSGPIACSQSSNP